MPRAKHVIQVGNVIVPNAKESTGMTLIMPWGAVADHALSRIWKGDKLKQNG